MKSADRLQWPTDARDDENCGAWLFCFQAEAMVQNTEMIEKTLDSPGESERKQCHPLGRVADRSHAFCEG